MPEPPTERSIVVQRRQFAEQLAGGGEQHGVAVDQRLMSEIAGQGRFAEAVPTDEDGIGGLPGF